MGFFDFIFGKKDNDFKVNVSVSTTSKINTISETKANKLAKEATQLKKEKKYEEALAKFQEALKAGGQKEFSIQMLLRLPMYYQLLGRSDDSWAEYQLLATKYMSPYDQAVIYDKMRLQLQKEKSNMGAIPFGVYAYIMRIAGFQLLVEQSEGMDEQSKQTAKEFKELGLDYDFKSLKEATEDDKQRVQDSLSQEAVLEMLKPLLKKAKVKDTDNRLLNGVVELGQKIAKDNTHCSYVDVHNLCKEILTKTS